MLQAVMTAPGQVDFREVTKPIPKENEVLLQILIAREPAIVASLPTATLFAIARSTPESASASAGGLSAGVESAASRRARTSSTAAPTIVRPTPRRAPSRLAIAAPATPPRLPIPITIPIVAASAGTNDPICAINAMSATCRKFVDLPDMFGPVMM